MPPMRPTKSIGSNFPLFASIDTDDELALTQTALRGSPSYHIIPRLEDLLDRVSTNAHWNTYLYKTLDLEENDIHLAIMAEPFYQALINGTKTIESRFTRNRCAPFNTVAEGDIIMFKKVCEPITALSKVKDAWYYDLRETPLDSIEERYADEIAADDEFWHKRSDAVYASLILLTETIEIQPIECYKRDRRGWISMSTRQRSLEL